MNFLMSMLNQYSLPIGIFVGGTIGLYILKTIVLARLHKLSEATSTTIDDALIAAVNRIGWPVYFLIPIYASSQFIDLPAGIDRFIFSITLVVATFYLAAALEKMVFYLLNRILKAKQGQTEVNKTISNVIRVVTKIGLWALAILLVLQNLGYNVTTLIGGLGIAGLAVGIALQTVLGDIFSFFTIYFDKPFTIGDFIVIGKDSGTIEKIGLKSTRIRTLQGQELVISNSNLTDERIQNYRKLEKRRVVMKFGVLYETDVKKLKMIPDIVAKIAKDIKDIDLDRVHLKTLNDFSLDYEVVYFVKSSDYETYMNAQQDLNLKLIEAFQKQKIEFPYPTQTVFVKK